MAYRNSDGKITIDEVAAQADVERAAQAAEILRQASDTLRTVISEVESFRGETAEAISEKAQALQRQISSMIGNLEETQRYTRRVVEHYQRVDREVREAIANSSATT